jgi:hypothetical protein
MSAWTACKPISPVSWTRVRPQRLDDSRADVRGAERGGGDADVRALEREHLHEPHHAVLGGHVARLVRRGDEAVHRGDDEEAPVARGCERVPRVLREQERARQQQCLQPVPFLLGEVPHGRHVLEARIRHDRVEASFEARERGIDDRAVALARRQVTVVDVHGVHAPAVGGESVRDRRADASGGAGDQYVSTVHRSQVPVSRITEAGVERLVPGTGVTCSNERRARRRKRACRRLHARPSPSSSPGSPNRPHRRRRRGTSPARAIRRGRGRGSAPC